MRAWEILGAFLRANADSRDTAVDAMVNIVDGDSLGELLRHVRSGELFGSRVINWRLEQLADKLSSVLRQNRSQLDDFVQACRSSPAPAADELLVQVLAGLNGMRAFQADYLLAALDSGRIADLQSPGASSMLSLFSNKREIGGGTYEISPAACNPLRAGLYARAKRGDASAVLSQRMLAKLECRRRDNGRPDDEPRHPDSADGQEWMRVLSQANSLLAGG